MSDDDFYDDEECAPVVIDSGTGMIKAGFAGEEAPRVVFPALKGIPKDVQVMGEATADSYVGEEALRRRGILELSHPIEHGIAQDWDAMEALWRQTFEDHLRVDSTLAPVLMTEAPLNPKKNRERCAEVMYETFGVPGLSFGIQAALSLFASGRTSGVVVDIGDGVTHTVPVYEGYAFGHCIDRMNIAGRELTEYFVRIMHNEGVNLDEASSTREIARDIKEKLCYVALDFDKEMQRAREDAEFAREYTLPDGEVLHVGTEMFECPEILFRPEMIGKETSKSVQKLLRKGIQACDIDVRGVLYKNIILSGGTTMTPGFDDRLHKEVAALCPKNLRIKVVAPPERKYTVWIGGSILASLASFQSMWITKEEYEEAGHGIVHKKCPLAPLGGH